MPKLTDNGLAFKEENNGNWQESFILANQTPVVIMRGNPIFVTSSENDLGPGRVVEWPDGNAVVVEYFDSPARTQQPRESVQKKSLSSYSLDEQTRVYHEDPQTYRWSVGRVIGIVEDRVFVRYPNDKKAMVPYAELRIRWHRPIDDPTSHLGFRLNETPYWHSGRAGFMRSLVSQRAACAGMRGLLSSVIDLEVHQLGVVRRVLGDPTQRYLLADEVGLGKTIESGVLIRQYVLDYPEAHRALVIVPEALVEQWRAELRSKFLLGDHLDKTIHVVPSHDLTSIEKAGRNAKMVVIDEAHHLCAWATSSDGRERQIFETVRFITESPKQRLLLLSATPVLHNEQGFLAMLHLLDPTVYRLEDLEAFRDRVYRRQELAEVLFALNENESNYFLGDAVDRLSGFFPQDRRLCALLKSLRTLIDADVAEDDADRVQTIRSIRVHVSETYRLHRRMLRNRRTEVTRPLTPGRDGLATYNWSDPSQVRVEEQLSRWRAEAALDDSDVADSQASRDRGSLAILLAEAALADHLALDAIIGARLSEIVSYFDQLALTSEDIRVIREAPKFESESAILRELQSLLLDVDSNLRFQRITQVVKDLLAGQAGDVEPLLASKIVVFTSYPATADRLYQRLRISLGDRVLRHSLSSQGGTPATEWMRFRSDPRCDVLVCDRRAEEGLNLQGGRAVLLHYDLPFSPNRIEQRMGRLDRFGVGKAVRSVAFVTEGSGLQSAWCNCLDQAFRVFNRSVATLQYVIEEELRRFAEEFLVAGVDAVVDLTSRMGGESGTIEREFKRIRAQDELDAFELHDEDDLQFHRELVELDRVSHEHRAATESWLLKRLQFKRWGESGSDDEVARYWHFCDENKGQGTLLPIGDFRQRFPNACDLNKQPRHWTQTSATFPMTFDRQIAQRRSVRLARLGEPLLDGLERYLRWDDRGVCFAMWRYRPQMSLKESPELIFRFDFLVDANINQCLQLLSRWPHSTPEAIRRLADELFPPIPRTIWLDSDLQPISDEQLLTVLEQPYRRDADVREPNLGRDVNLHGDRWLVVNDQYDPDVWISLCERAREVAEASLHEQLNSRELTECRANRAQRRSEILFTQLEGRLLHLSDRASAVAQQELDFERTFSETLIAGIRSPSVQLDAIGAVFLSRHDPFAALPDARTFRDNDEESWT